MSGETMKMPASSWRERFRYWVRDMSEEIERRTGIRFLLQMTVGNWAVIFTVLGSAAGLQWSVSNYEIKRDARIEELARAVSSTQEFNTQQFKEARQAQSDQFHVLEAGQLPVPTLMAQMAEEIKRQDDSSRRIQMLSEQLQELRAANSDNRSDLNSLLRDAARKK